MLEAFVIALREGVEAALIVGITLAYLAKIGRPELRKSVYAALGAAFLGSIGVAILLSRTNFNQDIFEGWVMLAAAFFVVTMVIFMMRTGRKLKGEIEGKVGLLAGEGSWFGLFAPPGTPTAIAQRLQAEIAQITARPDFRSKQLIERGLEPVASTPDEFGRFVNDDRVLSEQIVKQSGAQPQ